MKNYQYFFLLCFVNIILSEITIYALNLNNLIYENLAIQFTANQLNTAFENLRRWQFLGYLLIPIIFFIKTYVIAILLSVGPLLFNLKISFKKLLEVVLKAEFVFLFVGFIKVLWFYFFKTDFTIEELQIFYPLSVLSIIGSDGIQPWYIYPLQVINVFEIAYWIILALLLDKALGEKKGNLGIKIVASSYGPALLIWVVGVMFFTLNMS